MNDNKNTTVENISNNITQQNDTTNLTNNSKNTGDNKKSSTKTSKSKSSSNYDGGSDVDENGYMKAPPDDSGNWVVVNGKWKRAVTYENGHYYDYHGDNVDHKRK